MKVLHGNDAERLRTIERASGAFIWQSNDSTRVFLSGNPAAIARAHTALDAAVVPAAAIDVAAHWGGLISDGVHASNKDLMKVLHGNDAERLLTITRASGAVIWQSNDSTRVFLSGNAAAIARARTALDAVVIPAATIDVAAHWGGLIAPRSASRRCVMALPSNARLRMSRA